MSNNALGCSSRWVVVFWLQASAV